jgi:hypothetical protein
VSDTTNESVQAIERTLVGVETILSRMSAGSFRVCEVCGADIDDDLLISHPMRSSCVEHPPLSVD